jgi:hypothetical protein
MTMSALVNIKGLILSDYKGPLKVRKALLNLINELDNDLNVGGYETSSDVDRALEELDKALIEVDEPEVLPPNKEEEEVDTGYRELEIPTDESE